MHTGDPDFGSGGGGGDRPSDMERRLIGVEDAVRSMRTELAEFRLESTKMLGTVDSALAEIKGLLESKASVAEVSSLRGAIASLPTVWQLITLVFGILAGVFAIVKFGVHG